MGQFSGIVCLTMPEYTLYFDKERALSPASMSNVLNNQKELGEFDLKTAQYDCSLNQTHLLIA